MPKIDIRENVTLRPYVCEAVRKSPPGNIPPRKSPPWGLGLRLGLELGLELGSGVRGRNPSNPNPSNPNPSNLNPSKLNPSSPNPRGDFS